MFHHVDMPDTMSDMAETENMNECYGHSIKRTIDMMLGYKWCLECMYASYESYILCQG